MADNFGILDNAAAVKTLRALEISTGIYAPIAASDTFDVPVSKTRPADTTAYAVGDSVANSTTAPTAFEFVNIANRVGGFITIQYALLYSSRPTNSALFDLELFNGAAAPTATNDNAAYNPSDADRLNACGMINFPIANLIAGSSNKLWVAVAPLGLTIKCNAATASIWGLLRAGTAYTPDSAEVFQARLVGYRD